jgi:protein O-mannosyl-transferase
MASAQREYHSPGPGAGASGRRRSAPSLAVLIGVIWVVGVGLAAYSNSFTTPFLFDDENSIRENPTIRGFWPITKILSPPGEGRTVQGRPILNASLAVSYAISDGLPWGYHLLNLAIHLAAGLVLLGIVHRTLLLPAAGTHSPGIAVAAGGAAALLWTVHPLQTAAVTYIVQRAESMCGLLYLTTLYAFIRGATSARPAVWMRLSVVACLIGMGTKETMATAPLLILLYDRVFLSRSLRAALLGRKGYYAGLAATWGLLALLVLHSGNRGGTAGFTAGMSPWRYGLTQFGSIWTYLHLVLWPSPLVFDYGTALATQASQIVPYALALLVLLTGTALAFRRRAWLGFLGAWFFITLAPSSTIVPSANQTTAEHRMYLPLAAIAALIAAAICWIWVRLCERGDLGRPTLLARRRVVASALAGAVLLLAAVLGVLTHERNRDYQSVLSIWTDTIRKRPDNPRAWNNRGKTYEDLGDLDHAAADLTRAIEIDPDYATAYYNRGNVDLLQNRLEAAIGDYTRAIERKPDHVKALVNRGVAHASMGDYGRAISDYSEAIRLAPALPDAYNNRAVAYFATGNPGGAAADVEACRGLGGTPNPGLVDALRRAPLPR